MHVAYNASIFECIHTCNHAIIFAFYHKFM